MHKQTCVRWMIRRDMAEVLGLDQQCNERLQWREEDFLTALRQRNCIGMVAEQGDDVVGFMVYHLHKHHLELVRFAAPTEEILSKLLAKLAAKLSSYNRNRVVANIDERETRTLVRLKANEYLAVRVDRNEVEDEDGSLHDAIRMVYRLQVEQETREVMAECGFDVL